VLSGRLAALSGKVQAGTEQIDEGLAILHSLGDQYSLTYGYSLATQVDLDRGDKGSAARNLAALLAIAHDTHQQLACVHGLEGVAEVLADSDPERAVGLLATAAVVRRQLGFNPLPREQARVDSVFREARAALGDVAATVEAEGATRSLASALADALDACAWVADAPGQRNVGRAQIADF
jgi:hypothetical protein